MSVTRGCLASTGIALCVLLAACSGSTVSDNPIPPGLRCSASAFAPPPSSPPSPGLDGRVIDVALAHNALVYDACRNVYYASIPASQPSGNSIATIDPNTGQVSFSPPIGSEPNALAMAADGSVLYVGLDGTGDLAKLALPSMIVTALTRLPADAFLGQLRAESIAVSPASASVIAVALGDRVVSPNHAGVALLRDMVIQPKQTTLQTRNDVVLFDTSGTTLYGLDTETSGLALERLLVLPDGVADGPIVSRQSGARSLAFADGRVIASHEFFDASTLATVGRVSTGSVLSPSDCRMQRSRSMLVCFDTADSNTGPARILLADPGTFVIQVAPLYADSEPGGPHRLVEGPAGQVAISYPVDPFFPHPSKIRLFASAALITTPVPPPPSWQVTPSTTPDGQVLDIGIVHNALVYDPGRNLYYASVPGSVIGAGNTIATIDPATGAVVHSAPIGSEPDALAIAPDGSVLYVGLDGSGEVQRLTLPSMTPAGRTRLLVDPFDGRTHAEAIAVSPLDASVAVSMAIFDLTPTHQGVALLRDMAMQPKVSSHFAVESNLVVFDSAQTKVYGVDSEFGDGLHRIAVLADGLVEEAAITVATRGTRALSFANNRLVAGPTLYNAPALTAAGTITGATDCWASRAGTGLLCFGNAPAQGRVLTADSGTLAVGASLLYAPSEANTPRRLVQGPSGQIAVSYVPVSGARSILLFTSAQLP